MGLHPAVESAPEAFAPIHAASAGTGAKDRKVDCGLATLFRMCPTKNVITAWKGVLCYGVQNKIQPLVYFMVGLIS